MYDREKYPQELAVGNLGWVIDYLYRFGVAGILLAYLLIGGGSSGTARVPGCCIHHSLDALEDGLCAPEAAACKDGCLLVRRFCQLGIDFRRGNWGFRGCSAA